ncbi:MAG: phosphoribosylaminoimidazolesuccinocarboxamide synthase [Deltaproteobacteria bacterium]|nr:MAG: phosphoribosylaminoimidazolesuccinocarboxamide synthase [Deltaproteobacteria bacterium]
MSDGTPFLQQLPHCLESTHFDALGEVMRGKVRDVYRQEERLIMVTTDRLSAFDQVLTTIPFKGEALTRMAVYWFRQTEDIIENHLIDTPDPNVMVVRACKPVPIEIVVRGYLTGSLWRDYQAGRVEEAYGLSLPAGLRKDQRFETPLITPTTKAERGEHDRPIRREEILRTNLVPEAVYESCERAALALFARGQEIAAERGLILVDTKYEFGLADGRVVLMDEIHTSDSSRYWIADTYEERFEAGEDPQMLDKENIRQWLLQRGYQGDGTPPPIPDEVRADLAETYVAAFERITGQRFPLTVGPVEPRIRKNLVATGYLPEP